MQVCPADAIGNHVGKVYLLRRKAGFTGPIEVRDSVFGFHSPASGRLVGQVALLMLGCPPSACGRAVWSPGWAVAPLHTSFAGAYMALSTPTPLPGRPQPAPALLVLPVARPSARRRG